MKKFNEELIRNASLITFAVGRLPIDWWWMVVIMVVFTIYRRYRENCKERQRKKPKDP